MLIFPAIDILGGKAVRLYKGDYNQVTVYGERPWEIAQNFVSKGASAIHIVDLDGAREGSAVNMDVVRKIACIPNLLNNSASSHRERSGISCPTIGLIFSSLFHLWKRQKAAPDGTAFCHTLYHCHSAAHCATELLSLSILYATDGQTFILFLGYEARIIAIIK